MAKAGPRKKLPKEVAIINADNCTGCESCLEVCPVDCIQMITMHHGVKGNQSWCEIDIERCVGCEVCVHIPQKKTNPYELTVCPWNAIDLILNPNFKEVKEWGEIWPAYFAGADPTPDFRKLEELGYDLYLNRMIRAAKGSELEKQIGPFTRPDWSWGESHFAVLELSESQGPVDLYACTPQGDELVEFLYQKYEKMFLD